MSLSSLAQKKPLIKYSQLDVPMGAKNMLYNRDFFKLFQLIPVLSCCALLNGCLGGGSGAGTSNTGNMGASDNKSVAVKTLQSAPATACPNGGITVQSGIDTNGNGILDPSEVTNTQYVCDGSNGTNGTTALVSVTTEPPGINCPTGGNKISAGLDTNGNGILDSSEITSTSYICNGTNGTNFAAANRCESFGLSSAASAATNTAALQACLNSGGTDTITTPGNYNYYGTLTINSDTEFAVGAGVNLVNQNSPSGYAVKSFVNKNWQSTVYPVSGNLTGTPLGSGRLAFVYAVTGTTTVNHNFTVGSYVLIKGDLGNYYNGVQKITAVTANTFTFNINYSGTLPASTGNITAALADSNITINITGYVDGNVVNGVNPASGGLDEMGFIFNKVGNLHFVSLRAGGFNKYVVQMANIDGFVSDYTYVNNPSDGLHFNSPARNVSISNTSGNTGDDMIAFTQNNTGYNQYALPDDTGDFENIAINTVQSSGQYASMVALYPSAGNNVFRNVSLTNLSAPYGGACAVTIASGSNTSINYTASGSNTIAVTSPSSLTQVSNGMVLVSTNIPANSVVTSVSGQNITLNNSVTTSGSATVLSAGNINDVTIDGLTFSQQNNGAAPMIQLYGAANVGSLTVKHVNPPPSQLSAQVFTYGTTSSGSNVITSPGTTSGVTVGMYVIGSGIPAGVWVTAVSSNITLSQSATASVAATPLQFSPPVALKGPVIGFGSGGASVASLELDDSNIMMDGTSGTNMTTGIALQTGLNSSINNLTLNNIAFASFGYNASASLITTGATSRVGNVVSNNLSISGISGYANLTGYSTNNSNFYLSNTVLNNAQFLFGPANGTTTYTINGLTVNGTLSGPLFNFYSNGTYNLNVRGLVNNNTSAQPDVRYPSAGIFNILSGDGTLSIKSDTPGQSFTYSLGAMWTDTQAAAPGIYLMGPTTAVRLAF